MLYYNPALHNLAMAFGNDAFEYIGGDPRARIIAGSEHIMMAYEVKRRCAGHLCLSKGVSQGSH